MATPKEIDIDDDVEDEADAEEKPKRSNMIVIGAASVAAAGVAAGAAFVLAPSPSADTAHDETETSDTKSHASAGADKQSSKHGGKKNNKAAKLKPHAFEGGELQIQGESAFFVLDPLVISIRPIAQTKHLRISLVLETSLEEASALLERIFHVQDILNTYLRSVDREAFENPAAMGRLRSQIRRRIHAIAPDVTIDNVLITEFILT